MRPLPQQRISRKALKVWSMTAAIPFIIILVLYIVYVVLSVRFGLPGWIAAASGAVLAVLSFLFIFLLPKIRWQRWRYEVHENEVDLQRGVWIVKRTLIPMVRVQHVDTEQGPFLRRYGLATVMISTAATVHEIPALALEEADVLRDRISELARVAKDDV